MRSKRSKAWHRRKLAIARARALIEQGYPELAGHAFTQYGALTKVVLEKFVNDMMKDIRESRERVVFDVLTAGTGAAKVSSTPRGFLKFRRWVMPPK